MYKEKFAEWRLVKNLSRRVSGKLCRVADERKPKDTKFVLGPKTWSADEVRRKWDRANRDGDQFHLGKFTALHNVNIALTECLKDPQLYPVVSIGEHPAYRLTSKMLSLDAVQT